MNTSTRFRKTIKNLYLLLDQLIDFGLEKVIISSALMKTMSGQMYICLMTAP